MVKKKISLFMGGILLTLPHVYGYIDPGTAGTIIGGSIWPMIVMAFTAMGAFMIKYFWLPIKTTCSKITGIFKK